jgi:hypothetical protein
MMTTVMTMIFTNVIVLLLDAKVWTGGILTTLRDSVNAPVCKELLIHFGGAASIRMAGAAVC